MRHTLCPAMLVMVACGGDGDAAMETADAGGAAPIDGAPIDDATLNPDAPAPPAEVRITRFYGDQPMVGADVIWNDASGAPVAHALLDATGSAAALVAPGSSVTVIGANGVITSVLDVQPGDDIQIGPFFTPPFEPLAQTTAQLPGTFAGAAHYYVDVGCNMDEVADPTQPYTIGLYTGCLDAAGKHSLLAYAFDAQLHRLAFTSLVDLTPGSATVTLPAWRTDFSSFDVTVTGAPASTETLQVYLANRRGGVPYHDGALAQPLGDGTLSIAYSDAPFDHFEWHVTMKLEGGSELSYQQGVAAPLQAVTLDVATMFLPVISAATADVPAGASTPRLTWTQAGSLAGADGLQLYARWQGATQPYAWYVFAPPTLVGSLQFPQLPDELAQHRVAPGQSFLQQWVRARESTLWPDAKAHREQPVPASWPADARLVQSSSVRP